MIALVLHQYRYDQRQFWREPASVFFTVGLPLIFLVLFTSIFGNDDITVNGLQISGSTYYVPSILTLEIVSATFLNLVIWIVLQRERGQLKRVRATPVPGGVVIGGRALTSFAIAILAVVLLCIVGVAFYGVDLPSETLPAFVVSVFIGVLSLSAVGFAFSAFVPSENAAPAMANFVALPIYFISGHLRARGDAARLDVQARQRVPGQAVVRRAADGVQPRHDRVRVRVGQAGRGGGVGRGRAAGGHADVPVDAARVRGPERRALRGRVGLLALGVLS